MGVILYVMVCGRYPFLARAGGIGRRGDPILLERLQEARFELPDGVETSAEFRDLLTGPSFLRLGLCGACS